MRKSVIARIRIKTKEERKAFAERPDHTELHKEAKEFEQMMLERRKRKEKSAKG